MFSPPPSLIPLLLFCKMYRLTPPSTDVNFIASQAVARGNAPTTTSSDDAAAGAVEGDDAMAALERQARAPAGFVAASSGLKGNIAPAEENAANPDAIDLDDDL